LTLACRSALRGHSGTLAEVSVLSLSIALDAHSSPSEEGTDAGANSVKGGLLGGSGL